VDQGVNLGEGEGVVGGFVQPAGTFDVGTGQSDEGEHDPAGFEGHVSTDTAQQRSLLAVCDVRSLRSHDLSVPRRC
jgi:hypothetical protein